MTIDERPAGTILTFAEEDYRYGAGPLRLRIDKVLAGAPVSHDGDLWYEVEGATVRASRLPTMRRGAS
jgi:hypothetical protein